MVISHTTLAYDIKRANGRKKPATMISCPNLELPDELLSCEQVAQRYGISIHDVQTLALLRGIGPFLFSPGQLVFSPAEVEALRPRRPGRPWTQRDLPRHIAT
jgi:hypothetical protein